MKQSFKVFIFSILGIFLLTAEAKEPQETVQQKNLRELVALSVGEFNNYNQINFQNNDFLEQKESTDYSQLHHIRKRIDSPHLDGAWLYAQINRIDRDQAIYRQSYVHYFIDDKNQIRSRVYSLAGDGKKEKKMPSDAFLAQLKPEQLTFKLPEGCDTLWRRELDQFIGVTDHTSCVIDSKYKNEKRGIFAEEIIGHRGLWGREGGYTLDGKLAFGLEAPNYYRYHRARLFNCWAAVRIKDDDWETYNDLVLHDEGGDLTFGEVRQYRLQLKQTEFPATDWSNVFEIFLYRNEEKKAFAYSWTEPGAKHIAVNLREVQASCKAL